MGTLEIKADLDLMERQIEQLKVDYEKFFVGVIKVEPTQLRGVITRTIQRYNSIHITNAMLAFRYKNLVARFITYQEYWNRILRMIEEGRNPKDYRRLAEQLMKGQPVSVAETIPARPSEPDVPVDRYATLYAQFSEKMHSVAKQPPPPDAFRKTLEQYEQKVREKHGSDAQISFSFESSGDNVRIKTVVKKLKS